MIKVRIYKYLKKAFEEDIVLIKNETIKDELGKPIKIPTEYKIKAIILNQKAGYKLLQQLDNSNLNSDKTLDIFFHEKIEVIPNLKDTVLYEDKKYLINKIENNTKFSDFWKGELIELSGNKK